ncbi:MAG: DivIVA domain-containing protein [Angelakisella sp.]
MEIPASFFNISFNKAMAFGYRTDDVDQFVTQAIQHIKDLQEENESLLDKMNILASNLSQYREEEDSLRSALVGAQKLGDSILKDSRNKAEIIMRDATARADKVTEEAALKLERQQLEYERIKKETSDFKDRLFMLYRSHLDMINSIPSDQSEPEHAPAERATPEESEEEYHSAFVQEDPGCYPDELPEQQFPQDEMQQKLNYLDQLNEAHQEEFQQQELLEQEIQEPQIVPLPRIPEKEPPRRVTEQASPFAPPPMVQMEFTDGSSTDSEEDTLSEDAERPQGVELNKVPYFDDEDDEAGDFEVSMTSSKRQVVSEKFGVLKFGDAFDLTDD